MKVFLKPTGLHSQAMVRVARALTEYAPSEVDIVRRAEHADLRVLHAIGPDIVDFVNSQSSLRFAIIQYCFKSAGASVAAWQSVWQRASLVWSYYDLPVEDRLFYCAPLGVDAKIFIHQCKERPTGVMTSGYITGPACEAIEEVALAAERVGLSVVHLGPVPVHGSDTTKPMGVPTGWRSIMNVADEDLAQEYGRSKWVSGLRYVEGFELPAAEGLLCGARPIVFDRPEMHKWYDGHAVFVPECVGQEMVEVLVDVLSKEPKEVTSTERWKAQCLFDWERIAKDFWYRLLENAV